MKSSYDYTHTPRDSHSQTVTGTSEIAQVNLVATLDHRDRFVCKPAVRSWVLPREHCHLCQIYRLPRRNRGFAGRSQVLGPSQSSNTAAMNRSPMGGLGGEVVNVLRPLYHEICKPSS
jgi:hypothetical protein